MGTRTVAWQDGQVVFFRAIMDDELGGYLNAGLPDTSGNYNDRVARNEGRITGFLSEVEGHSMYQMLNGKSMKQRVLAIPHMCPERKCNQDDFQ